MWWLGVMKKKNRLKKQKELEEIMKVSVSKGE